MGYWEEVKEVLAKGFDKAKEGIKEGADVVVQKTKEGADAVVQKTKEGAEVVVKKTKEGLTYAQLKTKLLFKQREFREAIADLGDVVHDLYQEEKDIYADDTVKELAGKVTSIENECKVIESEIEALGKEEKSA